MLPSKPLIVEIKPSLKKFLEEKKFDSLKAIKLFHGIELDDMLELTDEELNNDQEFQKINPLIKRRFLKEIRLKKEEIKSNFFPFQQYISILFFFFEK